MTQLSDWRVALSRSGLSANARHIALALALHMTEDGATEDPASLETLAAETRRSVSTVKRGLAEIEAAEFLKRSPGGGRGRLTSYQAAVPSPQEQTVLVVVEAQPKSAEKRSIDQLFGEFWALYPRKQAKKEARKAFERALRGTPVETILAGVRRLAADPNLPAKKYIPHPPKWLNQGQWEDEPLPEENGKPRDRALEIATGQWRKEVGRAAERGGEGSGGSHPSLPGT